LQRLPDGDEQVVVVFHAELGAPSDAAFRMA
jgi:hypothetical protein